MSAMSNGNLEPFDLVVRLVREMDRYHGFFPGAANGRRRSRLARPAGAPLALAAPVDEGRDGNGAATL